MTRDGGRLLHLLRVPQRRGDPPSHCPSLLGEGCCGPPTAQPPTATPLPTPAGLGGFRPWVPGAGRGLNVPQVLQLLLQLLGELLEGRPLARLQLPAALHQGVDGGRAALGGLHAVPLLQQLRHLLQALAGWRSQLGPPFPTPPGLAQAREPWDDPVTLVPARCDLQCPLAQHSPAWGRVLGRRRTLPTEGSHSSTRPTWRRISVAAGGGEAEAALGPHPSPRPLALPSSSGCDPRPFPSPARPWVRPE